MLLTWIGLHGTKLHRTGTWCNWGSISSPKVFILLIKGDKSEPKQQGCSLWPETAVSILNSARPSSAWRHRRSFWSLKSAKSAGGKAEHGGRGVTFTHTSGCIRSIYTWLMAGEACKQHCIEGLQHSTFTNPTKRAKMSESVCVFHHPIQLNIK